MIGERIKFRRGLNIIEAEIIEDQFEFESIALDYLKLKRTLVLIDEGDLVIVHNHNNIWYWSIYNNMEF